MHSWVTTAQWSTVNSLTLKCRVTLSSPLVPLLPICLISIFSLSLSHHVSLPLSLSLPLASCHSLFLSLSLLKTFSISTHTFSIKLAYQFGFGFFLLKRQQQEQEQPAGPPAWPLYSPHTPQLAAALLALHLRTDWLHPSLARSVCQFTIYPPLVIIAHSLTYKQRPICAQRCTIFFFWWWEWKIRVLVVSSSDSFPSLFPL